MSCPRFPRTHFPSLLCFLSCSLLLPRQGGLASIRMNSPPPGALAQLQAERWKAMEWAKTRDFSCRTPHLWRQDGICKHTRDYPRCQLQQRASNFATSKGRVSATCSPKIRSGNSSAGSAESLQGLTPCPSSVAFRAPGCSRNTAFPQFLSPPSIQC